MVAQQMRRPGGTKTNAELTADVARLEDWVTQALEHSYDYRQAARRIEQRERELAALRDDLVQVRNAMRKTLQNIIDVGPGQTFATIQEVCDAVTRDQGSEPVPGVVRPKSE